jgi:hypothetical protein
LAFSCRANEALGAALVRCEERYPLEGAHSVLVAVVDREAAKYQGKLAPIYEELFGKKQSDPLAPVKFEVIDRATDEAIQRLIAAGLIAPTARATRELYPQGEKPQPLSEEEQQRAQSHRAQASRKLKMAQLLGGGGLLEEEREALLQSAFWLSKALAVEARSAEPTQLEETWQAPASLLWVGVAETVREYAANPAIPSSPLVTALQHLLASTQSPG